MTVKFAGIDEIKNITITGDVLSAEDYDKWVVENEAKKKAEPTTAPKNSKVAKYSKPAVTKNKN